MVGGVLGADWGLLLTGLSRLDKFPSSRAASLFSSSVHVSVALELSMANKGSDESSLSDSSPALKSERDRSQGTPVGIPWSTSKHHEVTWERNQ